MKKKIMMALGAVLYIPILWSIAIAACVLVGILLVATAILTVCVTCGVLVGTLFLPAWQLVEDETRAKWIESMYRKWKPRSAAQAL